MKFAQRIGLSVGLIFILSGIYLMLPKKRHHDKFGVQNFHRRDLEIHRNKIWQTWSQIGNQSMCSQRRLSLPHYAEISTYDLYAATKFDSRYDGEWEMAPPKAFLFGAAGKISVPSHLTVILMPHSHNDPGWLKTVNEYYADQTKHILNNMVNKLTQYPNMTFIWAETVFFSMWWNELDDAVKMHVQRLARRGQLEFVSGGWVMPDEATTHFGAVIDQLTEGHQWLWNNLGIRPENVWSIDPFGLSGTFPYLWRLAGMRNMVIQRVHQSVKAALSEKHALEFYWRQAWDSSNWGVNYARHRGGNTAHKRLKPIASGGSASSDILCHIMPFLLYSIPYSCGPEKHVCERFDFGRAQDDRFEPEKYVEDITPKTVASNAQALVQQFRAKAAYYQFNVILVPIGDDFRYDKELEWDRQYNNYEKLMHYINNRQDWNVYLQWGTLKDYFRIVRLEEKKLSNIKQPVLSGDFFPYSDKDRDYWTGYYTTRPFDKYFCRDVQFLLNAAEQLNTLNYILYKKWRHMEEAESRFFHLSSKLQQARRSLGLFQHHDAITGTAKYFVAEDYEEYLLSAYKDSQDVMRQAIQGLLTEGRVETPIVFHPVSKRINHQDIPRREVLSISSAGRGTIVTFYNSLGQVRSEVVNLLVDSPAIKVISSQAKEVLPSQISPVWSTNHEEATVEENVFEISFEVTILPFSLVTIILSKLPGNMPLSLGGSTYFSKINVYNEAVMVVPPSLPFIQAPPQPHQYEDILVSNGVVELAIDPKSGSLIRITHLKSGHTTHLRTSFRYYTAKKGGAYIFSSAGASDPLFPAGKRQREKLKPLHSNIPKIRVSKNVLATFVDIYFSSIFQRITLYSQPLHVSGAIFLENTLSMQELVNKEIVLQFDTDIVNSDLSYFTDQNGFQFIRRRTLKDQPIEANYYPMTSGIILEDAKTRLNILSAQSHGCTCLKQGQLEIMLDRQLTSDDSRGLGEGIEDIKTTISRFAIFTETLLAGQDKQDSSSFFEPPLSGSLSLPALVLQDVLNQPILAFFSTVDSDVFFHSLTPIPLAALPCDVTAVSMRSLASDSFGYNGTILVLHRRGYDCSFQAPWLEDPALFCAPSNPHLTMDSIFGAFSYSNLRETTLTANVVKQTMTPGDKLELKPMEISTFHLFF